MLQEGSSRPTVNIPPGLVEPVKVRSKSKGWTVSHYLLELLMEDLRRNPITQQELADFIARTAATEAARGGKADAAPIVGAVKRIGRKRANGTRHRTPQEVKPPAKV